MLEAGKYVLSATKHVLNMVLQDVLPSTRCFLSDIGKVEFVTLVHWLSSPKAAVFDQFENYSGFSGSGRSGNDDSAIGRKIGRKVIDDFPEKPLPSDEIFWSSIQRFAIRNFEEERFQSPVRLTETCTNERLHSWSLSATTEIGSLVIIKDSKLWSWVQRNCLTLPYAFCILLTIKLFFKIQVNSQKSNDKITQKQTSICSLIGFVALIRSDDRRIRR